MRDDDRERTIRQKLSRMVDRPPAGGIATGFASLDAALGGDGLPRGGIVELFGPVACGKTTLAIQIVSGLQQRGAAAAWVDAEHAFDPAYAASLGLDLQHLPVVQPESAEQALDITRRLAASGALDLVVIDSAAALVPGLELEAGIGGPGPGLQARVLASGLRKLSHTVVKTGACIVFLNQTRMRRDGAGQERESSAGGAALKLYASARIALSRVTAGHIRFRVRKNKAAAAFGEGQLEWKPGQGFVECP